MPMPPVRTVFVLDSVSVLDWVKCDKLWHEACSLIVGASFFFRVRIVKARRSLPVFFWFGEKRCESSSSLYNSNPEKDSWP